MTVSAAPARPFSKAKAELSQLMDDVLGHRPTSVVRHRRERVVVVSKDDLAAALETFTFEPKVSVEDGEFTFWLPELNLIAGGETYDQALQELAELASEYAALFFERYGFYMETERRAHLPWLLLIRVTPPEQLAELLAPTHGSQPAPAESPQEAVSY